jgi:hypothetical protein
MGRGRDAVPATRHGTKIDRHDEERGGMATSMPVSGDVGPVYLHVRILLGMIVGLGLTHVLRHVARIIEHPAGKPVYWIHLLWVLSVFLFLLHFWWWEFRLSAMTTWTFNLYFFFVLYALLLYLLCVFVLPENLTDYSGYREYFYSRRRWFFGALGTIYLVDLIDTLLKGQDYFAGFGLEYPIRNAAYAVCCLIAALTSRTWYHAAFVILGLVYQLSWIVRQFEVM